MKLDQYRNSEYCLVCGYEARDIDNIKTKHGIVDIHDEFCRCCGVQIKFSYALNTPFEYRDYWVSEGCPFFDEGFEPKGWNKEMALAQIKANVPEELQ